MKKQSLQEEKELWLWTFFIISIFIIIIWWLFWYFVNDIKERGTFWDMFGAINALFSWLALAGIIYTMLLQRQELRLQRLELKANREELARTATAQENSERVLRKQAENLKATAKLNALWTLINYYNHREAKFIHNTTIAQDADEKRKWYIVEIESILNTKS